MSVDDWGEPGEWERDSPSAGDTGDDMGRAVARTVVDIQPREVQWLWHNRIPYGMTSEVCGDPGDGKSHLTLALATGVTLGVPLPGDPEGTTREPGHVLLVCMEDSPEATVRPRLERMGADLARVTILDGIRGEHGEPDPLDLSRGDHRLELRRLVEQLGVVLVVIDPVTAHLGGANEWKDSEVRSILAPLSRMADETGAAVLLVRHLRKSDSSRAIYRAGGSIAFTAAVRSSLLVGRPDGEERQRAVVRVKGNLSPEPPAVGFVLDEGGFAWTEGGDWTPADLLKGDTTSEERTAREEATEFLVDALADGPREAKQIRRAAEAEGIAWRTLQRTRREMGIEVTREGFPASSMWHPSSPLQSRQAPAAPQEGSRSGATEKAQAPQGFSAVEKAQSRHIPLYRESGATGEVSPIADTCADCGTQVESNPAFAVNRCPSCALAAGRRTNAGAPTNG